MKKLLGWTGQLVTPKDFHKMPKVKYYLNTDMQNYWCNIHNRYANYILERENGNKEHVCDPKLSGIMLSCRTVNITNEIEIIEE